MATGPITEFGKKLDVVMKEKKLTDSKLAAKLKMAQPQLFALKRTAKPRAKTMAKLSKVLGKPLDFWVPKKAVDRKSKGSSDLVPPAIFRSAGSSNKLKVYLIVEAGGNEIFRQALGG